MTMIGRGDHHPFAYLRFQVFSFPILVDSDDAYIIMGIQCQFYYY